MSKKQNSYNFDFNEVIIFLYHNWKRLIIISALGALLAFLGTGPWLITPKYKSVVVFYPGNTNSISTALFYTTKQKAQDPLMFAEQEITEQYMQLLQSEDLINKVIAQFELYKHYELDPGNLKDQRKMGKIYLNNVECSRTDFNSIKISVMDPSPEKAAEIANGIVAVLDEMKHQVQKKVAQQIFNIVEKEYLSKLIYTDSIKNRLKELGADGVYDLTNQAKGVSEAVGNGHSSGAVDKEKLKLGEHGGEVFMLITMLELEAENLTLLRTKYEQARVDLNGELSNVFVISHATASNDKAYPRKLLSMIVGSIAAFVMGCVVIIGADKIKEFQGKINP